MLWDKPKKFATCQKEDVWENSDINFLLAILALRTGKHLQAFKYFKYLKACSKSKKEKLIYQYAADFSYSLKYLSKTNNFIEDTYPRNFVVKMNHLLLNAPLNKVFKISPCFDCHSCRNKKTCSFENLLTLFKNIEYRYQNNIPKQENLKNIFNS